MLERDMTNIALSAYCLPFTTSLLTPSLLTTFLLTTYYFTTYYFTPPQTYIVF